MNRFHPKSGSHHTLPIPRPKKVSFVSLTERSDRLLLGCDNILSMISIDKENNMSLEKDSGLNMDIAVDLAKMHFGVATCSPYGELFFSVEPKERNRSMGNTSSFKNILYRMFAPKQKAFSKSRQYALKEAISTEKAVDKPSAICWDHGGRSLYVADAASKKLVRYVSVPFMPSLMNREEVFDFSELGSGTPSGIAVDSKGYVWVAIDGTGEVCCINPTKGFGNGLVTYKFQMPVKRLTSCAFVGKDLGELLITSRNAESYGGGRSRLPGSLFRVKLPG